MKAQPPVEVGNFLAQLANNGMRSVRLVHGSANPTRWCAIAEVLLLSQIGCNRNQPDSIDHRHELIGDYRGILLVEAVTNGVPSSHRVDIDAELAALATGRQLRLHVEQFPHGCFPTLAAIDQGKLRVERGVCNDVPPDDDCSSRSIEIESGEGAVLNGTITLITRSRDRQICVPGERLSTVSSSIRLTRSK